MPQQDNDAAKLDKAQEVDRMIFVPSHDPTEVIEPREESLYLPSAPVSSKRAPILAVGLPVGSADVGCDELDASLLGKPPVERIAVVGLVADQPFRPLFEEGAVEGSLDEGDFVGRSAFDANGDRKTRAVCNCHDLGLLTALGRPDAEPPFLAPTKEPSTKHSLTSIPPLSLRSAARARRMLRSVPSFDHCWNRRWQVWYDGKRGGRSFQRAPVWRIQRMPLSTSRLFFQGRPRPSSRVVGMESNGSMICHCSSLSSMHSMRESFHAPVKAKRI